MTDFIEVQPATEKGNTEPRILLNTATIVSVRPKTGTGGYGHSVIIAIDESPMPVWEPYEHLASQLLKGRDDD